MVDTGHLVSGGLNTVSLPNKPVQLLFCSLNILCQKPCRLVPVGKYLFQLHNISSSPRMVKSTCPAVL